MKRRWIAMALSAVALAASTAIITPPVQAMNPRPDFRLPFPCGETWELESRDNHDPQDKKIDFYAWDRAKTRYSPVLASAAGHITQEPDPGHGEVEINHGNGWFTTYQHMSGLSVKKGDYVGQGQVIGHADMIDVGGLSPQPHLHYEQAYDFNGDNDGDFANPTDERQIPVLEGRETNMTTLGRHHVISTNSCGAGGAQGAAQYDFGLDQQLQILARRTSDNVLMQRWYDPKTAVWHLNSIGHTVVGEPAVTVFNGELHVIARRSDNSLIDAYYSPRPGGGWKTNVLPGRAASDPDVAFFGQDKNLHVAARGTDGLLYRWWTTPSGWTNPVAVDSSVQVFGTPSIVGFNRGLYIVARASDDKVWSWMFGEGLPSAGRKLQLSGAASDNPDLSADPWSTRLHAVVRGTDNRIWFWEFDSHRATNGAWSAPKLLDANRHVAGAPATTIYRGGLHIVARGTDNKVNHWWRNSDGSWNWEAPGGSLSGNPTVFKYKDMFHITGRNASGNLTHVWYNGSWNQAERSLSTGGGGTEPPPTVPPAPPSSGATHADMNGDGKADLLAIYDSDNGLYWYPGKGDGGFWSARYLDQAGFKLMAKGDLNGDGKSDLLAIYEGNNGLYWYPGKGDGTFWSARYISQAGFRHMELADLNGDRILDMVAIYEGSNGLYWYPGKGDGTFWSARYIDQAGFKNMAVGDLNGDGKADLLAVYDGSLGLHWYPGKGDGTFWSARYISQAGFRHMELADLNGDGKRDMLAIYDGSGGLYWYPGKGDGGFWSARYLDQAGFKLMTL